MINQLQNVLLLLYMQEKFNENGSRYRVEDTVTRICRACNIPYVEVFATTTGIFFN